MRTIFASVCVCAWVQRLRACVYMRTSNTHNTHCVGLAFTCLCICARPPTHTQHTLTHRSVNTPTTEQVWLMVFAVHVFEAYFLNPQIYSSKLKLHPIL